MSKNEWLIHSLAIKDKAYQLNMSMLTTTCTVLEIIGSYDATFEEDQNYYEILIMQVIAN